MIHYQKQFQDHCPQFARLDANGQVVPDPVERVHEECASDPDVAEQEDHPLPTYAALVNGNHQVSLYALTLRDL